MKKSIENNLEAQLTWIKQYLNLNYDFVLALSFLEAYLKIVY